MSMKLRDDFKLAKAVLEGDLDAARRALSALALPGGRWGEIMIAARAAVNPPAPLPPVAPLVLPMPGQPWGLTKDGSPAIEVDQAA